MMKLEDALHTLPVGRTAKRLQPLWPAIEVRLSEGISHAEMLALLNGNGFDMSLTTFKTYLYRQRKKQHKKPRRERAANSPTATAAPIEQHAPEQHPSGSREGAKRPPTFDYDPRGIPDLLR